MINSKNRTACAYVKSNKSKPKLQNPSKQPTPRRRPSKDQKQNIYDELMNELEAEDSAYVRNLLAKQEKKVRKKESSQSNKQMKTVFGDKTHPNIVVSNRKNTNRVSTNKGENLQIVGLNNNKVTNRQSGEIKTSSFRGRNSQNYTAQPISKFQNTQKLQANSFVSHINQYIYELKSNQSTPFKKGQINQSREFRKTLQIADRRNDDERRESGISMQKYKSVLFQLQQSLQVNDQLQEENQFHTRKIEQAKLVVQTMWAEIKQLEDELNHQKHQKMKYKCLFQQFALRVKKIDAKSVDRGYLSHKKRNSHIPQPSSFFLDNSYNKGNRYNYYEERSKFDLSHLQRQREEPNTLKKKGKQHKYKISENCLQLFQKDAQSTASIYRQKFY